MNKISNFPERLKELRSERKVSTRQLGSAIGVANITICDWENQKSNPLLENAEKLAEYFGVTMNYMTGWEE